MLKNLNYARRRLRKPASPTSPLKSRTAVIGSGAETVPVPDTTSPGVRPANSIETTPPVQLGLSSSLLSGDPFQSSPESSSSEEQVDAVRPAKRPPVPEKAIIVEPKGPGDVPQEEKISADRKVGSQL